MGPGRKKIWLPLTRLSAFFVAVVVVGNVVFGVFRPAAADLPADPDRSADTFSRKKRSLDKQIQRALDLFRGGSAPRPSTEAAKERLSAMIAPSQPVVYIAASPVGAPPPISAPAAAPPALPLSLALPEPAAAFHWPAPLEPLGRPEFIPPRSMEFIEAPGFRAALIAEEYRRIEPDRVADIGDALFKGPELLLDGVVALLGGMHPRGEMKTWQDDEDRSITARILEVERGSRNNRIFTEFMTQWTAREAKYLAHFDESRAATFGVEDGREAVDMNVFADDQRKVLWDTMRRTYLARYKMQAEERVRDDAWYFDRWRGADFVVLPPLMGAYIYYRGLDKRFDLGESSLRISIEAPCDWIDRKRNIPCLAALEWSMKGLPLCVIVSAGLNEHKYGLDFIGVGTELASVRKMLVMLHEGDRR